MRQLALIAHNLRSAHNVGSLLRTAEGLGVSKVYLTGYTPYPISAQNDERMPHIASKLAKQIQKTALGAEAYLDWRYESDITKVIEDLKTNGFEIVALEQTKSSIALNSYQAPSKVAVIVGREVEGIEPEIIKKADLCVEIPMAGKKESFNVVQAAAMALYSLRFLDN